MNESCSCGRSFRTGEDHRDHMPCEGSKLEQANALLAAANARIVELETKLANFTQVLCPEEETAGRARAELEGEFLARSVEAFCQKQPAILATTQENADWFAGLYGALRMFRVHYPKSSTP